MSKKAFDQIAEGLNEALAVARGKKKPAQRCKFSQEGLEALAPRRPDRMGTMVSDTAIYRGVRWDGLKSTTIYAKRFIEPLDDEQSIDMRGLLSDAAE